MNKPQQPDCLVAAHDVGHEPVGVVHAVRPSALGGLEALVGEKAARFALQAGFVARYGQVQGLPDADGNITTAVLGVPEAVDGADPFVFGILPDSLPSGLWRISAPTDVSASDMALGFCFGAYRMPAFGRDSAPKPPRARLVVNAAGLAAGPVAQCINLARSLINTPPNLMGPDDLARAAQVACSHP